MKKVVTKKSATKKASFKITTASRYSAYKKIPSRNVREYRTKSASGFTNNTVKKVAAKKPAIKKKKKAPTRQYRTTSASGFTKYAVKKVTAEKTDYESTTYASGYETPDSGLLEENSGDEIDINELMFLVMREVYEELLEDLQYYAQKMKLFNGTKQQIRDELTRIRKTVDEGNHDSE